MAFVLMMVTVIGRPKNESITFEFLDPDVRIPLTWPFGTYGLPMAKSGCPKGTFWNAGTRYHDTEDHDPNNSWSHPYDLAGHVGKSNMDQKFCMKTRAETSQYNLPWPKGQYCIYKKGTCPQGGSIAVVVRVANGPYFNK